MALRTRWACQLFKGPQWLSPSQVMQLYGPQASASAASGMGCAALVGVVASAKSHRGAQQCASMAPQCSQMVQRQLDDRESCTACIKRGKGLNLFISIELTPADRCP